MYKILNLKGLGVAGRQNELIELALTHKFQGVEVDMKDLVGRHDTLGKKFACQFLQSANMDLGTFDLPIAFAGDEAAFKKSMEKLDTIIDLAKELNATRCRVRIEPNSPTVPFQENFETHGKRIHDVAEKFADHDLKIGLYLSASSAVEADGNYKFIRGAEELLTLIKAIGHPGVGLALDAFEWVAGEGGLDQVSDLDVNAIITEVCLADMPEDADPSKLNKTNRVLPGHGGESFSLKLCQMLKEKSYEGPYSISTDLSIFAGNPSRHNVVSKLSKYLDKLAEGEDPAQIERDLAAEEEARLAELAGEEAGGEGDAEGEAKTDDAAPTADAASADKDKEKSETVAAE